MNDETTTPTEETVEEPKIEETITEEETVEEPKTEETTEAVV